MQVINSFATFVTGIESQFLRKKNLSSVHKKKEASESVAIKKKPTKQITTFFFTTRKKKNFVPAAGILLAWLAKVVSTGRPISKVWAVWREREREQIILFAQCSLEKEKKRMMWVVKKNKVDSMYSPPHSQTTTPCLMITWILLPFPPFHTRRLLIRLIEYQ